jgi:hypothetical protein
MNNDSGVITEALISKIATCIKGPKSYGGGDVYRFPAAFCAMHIRPTSSNFSQK